MSDENKKFWRVTPLTISMETVGGISTPLVFRGTPLPLSREQTFSTASDNQESVEIKIYLGESPLSEKNMLIHSFHLNEIPPAEKGNPQISVKFNVSNYLDINISAIETKSKKSISVDLKSSDIKIDESVVKELIEKSKKEKEDDNIKLNKIETINNANNSIHKAENFIKSSAQQSNREKVERAIAELGLAIDSDNLESIREKTTELNNSMNTFDSLFDSFFGNIEKPKKSKTTKIENDISTEKNYKDIGKIFGGNNFTLDPNLCFVLMPFSEELKPIYDDHIVKVVKTKNMTAQRADEIYSVNLITWDIWEKINRARIIIADLTNKNPNVFYELGLAHAIGKEVIIIAQRIEDVPFDLKALRCIVYEYNPRGVVKLEERLSSTLDELLRNN